MDKVKDTFWDEYQLWFDSGRKMNPEKMFIESFLNDEGHKFTVQELEHTISNSMWTFVGAEKIKNYMRTRLFELWKE